MSSKVFKRGPTTPQMNITPLIDVVFLLIVFFMLVNTIQMQQVVEMVVPELEDAQVQDLPQDGRVVVNVAPQRFSRTDRLDNPLRFIGRPSHIQVGLHQQYAIDDLVGVTAALERIRERNPDIEVILRADSAIYYQHVEPIMNAITAAGIHRINLVASTPAPR